MTYLLSYSLFNLNVVSFAPNRNGFFFTNKHYINYEVEQQRWVNASTDFQVPVYGPLSRDIRLPASSCNCCHIMNMFLVTQYPLPGDCREGVARMLSYQQTFDKGYTSGPRKQTNQIGHIYGCNVKIPGDTWLFHHLGRQKIIACCRFHCSIQIEEQKRGQTTW